MSPQKYVACFFFSSFFFLFLLELEKGLRLYVKSRVYNLQPDFLGCSL